MNTTINPPPSPVGVLSKVLLVAAMDVEAKAILSKLPSTETLSLHDDLKITAYRTIIGERQIVLAQAGVGQVNGALTTSYAIDAVKPSAIFLLGVAGALDERLNIGDAVVARQILQHDAIYSGEIREFMAPGELHVSIPKAQRPTPWLETDAELSFWVTNQLKKSIKVHRGTLLSGSEFVGNTNRKIELAAIATDALAVEMEASGVGQIARKRKIPLVVVKTIADRMDPDGTISSDYLRFSHSASDTAANIVTAIIDAWSD